MNYDKMSDFEINRKVLEIKTGVKPLGYAHDADGRSACVVLHGNHYAWFDFCNSWADAGPIIQQNLIDLEAIFEFTDESEEQLEPTGLWAARAVVKGFIHPRAEDKNPLRAAMIVFLMMQEGV